MFTDLYNIFVSWAKILNSTSIKNKIPLMVDYARLRLKNRFFLWTGQVKTSESVLGLNLCFFNYSTFVYLFEEIFVRQTYYFSSAKPNPFIIDCGSNIGLSILFLKKLYPDARVIAFEPDRATFETLQKNIQQNGIQGVKLYNHALMDREGVLEFYTDTEKPGSLSMSYLSSRGGQIKTQIPCFPLSKFITEQVDFLKMDIEGAEAVCIQELQTAGRLTQIREMIIECHHNMSDEKTLSKIFPTLDNLGYKYQLSTPVQRPYNFKQDIMVHAVQL